MATVKQREANQRNAQFSSGPKTQEGKDKVRLNPVKHGLRTEVVNVLPSENPTEFVRRLESLSNDYAPRTEIEIHLVHQLALLTWKIERADRYEIARLSEQVVNAVRPCLNDPTIEPDHLNEVFVDAADLASFDASNDGERLRRHQVSLQRALFRTLDRLGKPRGLDADDADEADPACSGRVSDPADRMSPVLDSPIEAEAAIPVAQPDTAGGQAAEAADRDVEARSESSESSREHRSPDRLPSPRTGSNSKAEMRASKPNLLGGVKLSSVFDKPRTIVNPPKPAPSKSGGPGRLDNSLDKR
jgi:hypothetical protein